ncbi:M35 family metallo-endopeptidase [Salipiger thiooxidans]|uniref:M35 family metallo-endopeptidase n=1 Tax=Salipiger thiooxidans TaxID=282683 RepID=UPI001CD1FDE7|nr:M35 family metallo-endopeptidase [Salipiger thiooxidans]MCA0850574.1 hypothetical protein [Salipiger thiooxidans]
MSKSSRTAILILCLAFAAPLHAAGSYDEFRVPCSASEKTTVATALAKAKKLAQSAASALPASNSATGAKFQRWFGGEMGDDDPIIRSVYVDVAGRLDYSNIWCANKSLPNSDDGTLAWVPGDATQELFLEGGFFALKTTGADSQAGTLVHEAGHLSIAASIIDSDVTGDDKPDYGIANAEQLARTHPGRARRTADNLQYFSEDITFGLP